MLYRNPLTSENDKMQNQVIKLHCQSSQILSSIVFSLITFFRSWQTAMILIFSSHIGHKSCGLWKRHCQQQFPCLDCRFSCSLNLAAPGERLSIPSPYTQQAVEGAKQGGKGTGKSLVKPSLPGKLFRTESSGFSNLNLRLKDSKIFCKKQALAGEERSWKWTSA